MGSYTKPDVPKCVVFNFLCLEDGFFSKSFMSEKKAFPDDFTEKNVLRCTVSRKIGSIFVQIHLKMRLDGLPSRHI